MCESEAERAAYPILKELSEKYSLNFEVQTRVRDWDYNENDLTGLIEKTDLGWVCLIDRCGPFCDIKTMIQHFEILGLGPEAHDRKYRKFLKGCEGCVRKHRLVTIQERFEGGPRPEPTWTVQVGGQPFKGRASIIVMVRKLVTTLIIIVVLIGAVVVGYPYLQTLLQPSTSTSSTQPPVEFHPIPLNFNNSLASIIGNFSAVSFSMNYTAGPINITDMHIAYSVSNLAAGKVLNVTYSSPQGSGEFPIYFQNGAFVNFNFANVGNSSYGIATELWFILAAGVLRSAGLNSTNLPINTTKSEFIGPTAMVVTTYSGAIASSNTAFSLVQYSVAVPLINTTVVVPVGLQLMGESSGQPISVSFKVTSLTYTGSA